MPEIDIGSAIDKYPIWQSPRDIAVKAIRASNPTQFAYMCAHVLGDREALIGRVLDMGRDEAMDFIGKFNLSK